MKKIKIFLVADEVSLRDDKLEIGNFIRHLNDVYEPYQLYFQLLDENSDFSSIEESELFFILFESEFNEKMKEMFVKAYNCFKNVRKPGIVTYMKNSDVVSNSVLEFMKRLDEEIGHYYNHYSSVDTVKLNMMMHLQALGFEEALLEVKDGKVFLDDEEFVILSNIPMVKNNKELFELKRQLQDIDKEYWSLKEKIKEDSSDEVFEQFGVVTVERNRIQKLIFEIEKNIVEFEKLLVENSLENGLSKRQIEAKKCLDNGDLEGAKEILSFDEIKGDVDHLLEVQSLNKNKIQIHVNELLERIYILRRDIFNSLKYEEIDMIYKEVLRIEREALLCRKGQRDYIDYLVICNRYEEAYEVACSYYYHLKGEGSKISRSFYSIFASICVQLEKYEESLTYYFCVLDFLKGIKKEKRNAFNKQILKDNLLFMFNVISKISISLRENYLLRLESLLDGLELDRYDKVYLSLYSLLVQYYEFVGDHENAIHYYELFLKYVDKDDSLNLAIIYYNLGKHYVSLENYDKVLMYFSKTIKDIDFLIALKPYLYKNEFMWCFLEIGDYYRSHGMYEDACACYLKGVSICEEELTYEEELDSIFRQFEDLSKDMEYDYVKYFNLNINPEILKGKEEKQKAFLLELLYQGLLQVYLNTDLKKVDGIKEKLNCLGDGA